MPFKAMKKQNGQQETFGPSGLGERTLCSGYVFNKGPYKQAVLMLFIDVPLAQCLPKS